MLLRELFEKKLDIKKVNKPTTGLFKTSGLDVLGSGWQAVAYQLKKRPGTIVKTIAVDGESDPHYQFLRVCKNNPNNPYLPNIYAMKMYDSHDTGEDDREERMRGMTDKEMTWPPQLRKYIIVCSMEKLLPFTSTIGEDDAIKLLNNIGINPQRPSNAKDSQPLTNYVANIFRTPESRQQVANTTSDPMLKQALRLLEPLFRKFHPDLHTNNMMLRESSNGYQLVFIDPVSDPDFEEDDIEAMPEPQDTHYPEDHTQQFQILIYVDDVLKTFNLSAMDEDDAWDEAENFKDSLQKKHPQSQVKISNVEQK